MIWQIGKGEDMAYFLNALWALSGSVSSKLVGKYSSEPLVMELEETLRMTI